MPLIVDSFSVFDSFSISKMNKMSIHKQIRDGRVLLKLTEQQFADAVGVSRSAVQQWEREGGTAPTRKNQPKVAELLGISVAELMGEIKPGSHDQQKNKTEEHAVQEFSAEGGMAECLKFLATYLEALDAGDRAEALRMVSRLGSEPEKHASVARSIEGMASAAFAQLATYAAQSQSQSLLKECASLHQGLLQSADFYAEHALATPIPDAHIERMQRVLNDLASVLKP